MVAQTFPLPNLRKMFIPDPDHIIIDVDLKGADAQVLAADANELELLRIFREGVDIHTKNAQFIYDTSDINYDQRQRAKKAVHGTNYGETARGLAISIGITIKKAEAFQDFWFSQFPGIHAWQRRIWDDLKAGRPIRNAWKHQIKFLGRRYPDTEKRPDDYTNALAWIPQSTVGITTDMGILNVEETLPQVQPLLQVHDSAVFQVHKSLTPDIYPAIISAMQVPIPYDPPLTIPVNLSASEKSWGDVEKIAA